MTSGAKSMRLETVAQQAFMKLRQRILDRELKPGQPLRQNRIAKEMGIGTNPLREAMVRLECEGMIEMIPLWGARVRTWDEEQIRDLAELRLAIECQTARLCAERASDEELVGLEPLAVEVDAMVGCGTKQEMSAVDAAFHAKITRYARSKLLFEQFERQNLLRQLILRIEFDERQHVPRLFEPGLHTRLLEAIASRDPDHAEREMRWHIERVEKKGTDEWPQYVHHPEQ